MEEKRPLNFVPPEGRLFMIGIAGPSGSGKSSLARALASALSGWSPVMVPLDSYYKDLRSLPPELRAGHNFDHPDALDRALAVRQLGELARGIAIDVPVYDFVTHTREAEARRVEPGWVAIVEGLFALYWEEIRAIFDLKIFLEAGYDLCLRRRAARDVRLRGRDEDLVHRQYHETVLPMFERYIHPTRQFADLLLRGENPLERSMATILEWIEHAAGKPPDKKAKGSRVVMSEEKETAERKLPPYVVEGARSGRSKCRTCRRKIDRGILRLGILIEGPYGTGYIWHHLKCAARSRFENVEEAYRREAWKEAKEPPADLPSIEQLRSYRTEFQQRKKIRKKIPYAEADPSGRARCKECGELIEKGTIRIVLGKVVEFGSQVRTAPINVHPGCVAAKMKAEDCATESDGFDDALRLNSGNLPADTIEAVLEVIGELQSRGPGNEPPA
jgi:uridine kinase